MFGLEMLHANIDEAVPEAQVRSLRKGFLGEQDYQVLKQTNSINEFKIVIEDTDYGSDIFSNQVENDFDVQALRLAMKERLMTEIQYLISQSSYPLNQFLTMILHKYQIDNVVLIIEGLKPRPDGKPNLPIEELMRIADPLGLFPELKNVQPVDGEDYASLYQQVLVDLPVGVYFRKFLNEVTAGAAQDEAVVVDSKYISDAMQDYSLLQVQLRVRKIWLQEFYKFCRTELNETSTRVMTDLLKFESDWQTIQIIENSRLYSGLVDARGDSERKKYISKVGYLYPERFEAINAAQDFKGLVNALEASEYHEMLLKVSNGDQENESQSQGKTIGK